MTFSSDSRILAAAWGSTGAVSAAQSADIAVQTEGRIVVAGGAAADFALVRYQP